MKHNRNFLVLIAVSALIFSSLACKAVTRAFETEAPPTNAPFDDPTKAPATNPDVEITDEPNATHNSNGVRYCYYEPGVSKIAEMPPEVVADPTPYAYPTAKVPAVTKVGADVKKTQLKVFQQLWDAVDQNYVYTDYNGKNWKEIGERYKALIQKGLSDDDFYASMSQMIYELEDEHSNYLSPQAVKEDAERLAGSQTFVGIGAMVSFRDETGEGIITSIFPGSPAEKAGLRVHDKIVKVGDQPVIDQETGQSRTLGPEGTEVTITMQRPGEEPVEVTMVRAKTGGSLPIDYCIVRGTKIGYIYLPSFYDESIDDQTREALEKMGRLDGLVIDNRTNGGGISSVVEPILGFFTDGTQGHYVSRKESEPFEVVAEDINGSQEVPLVILVDADTVSFGEIFSGILRVNGRAKIVGRNTLGNVEVLFGYNFDDGSRAWIASATFEPVGLSSGVWERTGIIPDFSVPTRWDLFTEATDPALAKAVEILLGTK